MYVHVKYLYYASCYLHNYSGRVVEEIWSLNTKEICFCHKNIYSYLVISDSYGRT